MELLEVCKALSDESRLRIIRILDAGFFNVGELTEILDLSQPTVSHHLKVLERCGIAKSKKNGTWAYYSLGSNGDKNGASNKIVTSFLDVLKDGSAGALSDTLVQDESSVREVLEKRREKSRHFFDSIAKEWKEIRAEAEGHHSFIEILSKRIPPDITLLELGCGSGALLEAILPRKGDSIGVDYSQAMLEEARKNLGPLSSSVDLRLGYLEHLPLGDGSVDMAVAHMVMHHLPDPRKALMDTYRVLKDQGVLCIVDLTQHQNEAMRERFSDLWLGFRPEEFQSWIKEIGFKDSRIEFFGEKKEVFFLTAYKKCKD